MSASCQNNRLGVEGMKLTDKPVFSVQYHPEACPGPHDSRYLFDEFVANMKKAGVKKLVAQ